MKRTIYIIFLLSLLSCAKEGGSGRAGGLIEFSVATPDMMATKAEVSKDEETGGINTTKLFIYGAKSNGTTSENLVDAPGAPLIYNSTTGVWNPQVYNYQYSQGNLQWEDDFYYRFYGFAYSANANSTNDQGTIAITNDTYGRQFTVTQPETGDGANTVDYLLSYLVNVSPNTFPLVPIHLEHAMARVDVDVQIANSMFEKDASDQITGCHVQNISVSISGIKRKATMLCLQPKQYGEEGSHTWYITHDGAASPATYTAGSIDTTESNLEGAENGISPDMSFIAVPVTNEEMKDYVLTLTYHGNLSNTEYTYEFPLKDYSPNGWVNGHKVKYVLTIDNSIHLTGKILDYEDVDYIEAVIVPDVPVAN